MLSHDEKVSRGMAMERARKDARIAELETALSQLWNVAQTVSIDGKTGCFVADDDWRRLVVDKVHVPMRGRIVSLDEHKPATPIKE